MENVLYDNGCYYIIIRVKIYTSHVTKIAACKQCSRGTSFDKCTKEKQKIHGEVLLKCIL